MKLKREMVFWTRPNQCNLVMLLTELACFLVCFYSLFYKVCVHLTSNKHSATLLLPPWANPPGTTHDASASAGTAHPQKVSWSLMTSRCLRERKLAQDRVGRRQPLHPPCFHLFGSLYQVPLNPLFKISTINK